MAALYSWQSELETVEKLMNQEITFHSAGLGDLIDLPMNNLDKYLYPSIVLVVSNLMSEGSQKRILLAVTFQYVYLAHTIHRLVTDQEMPEQARRFPILTGDFMFGQSFSKICEADLFSYAIDFVKAIETMNEGVIMRWRLKDTDISQADYIRILEKERASLTALAGKLAASLAGFNEAVVRRFEVLGHSLGMAWALCTEQLGSSLGQQYLDQAERMIDELGQDMPVKELKDLYEWFSSEIQAANIC